MGLEPEIIINGIKISDGASMTIRVAIEEFANILNHDGLGEDRLGKEICKDYLERISDIRKIIFDKNQILT